MVWNVFVIGRDTSQTNFCVDLTTALIVNTIFFLHQEFSLDDLDSLITGWSDKLVRCADGDQKWGMFFARKPVS